MTSPRSANPTTVALAYAIVCVVWGSTYLFIKLGVDVMPPYLLGGLRFSLAGIVLLTGSLATRRSFPRDRATLLRTAAVGVLLLAAGNGFLNTSERYISTGLAALLVTTFPLWATFLSMLGREGERLAPIGWAGLLVGLAGVALLVDPFQVDDRSWIGIVTVLAASFSWAVGTVYARRHLRSVDPFAASAIETAVAGPIMLLIHVVLERGEPIVWGHQAWLAVGYLAIVGSLVGFTAFVFLSAHMSSTKVGSYAYVNPVVAVLLGWLFLGEPLTWRLALGGGTILSGLLMIYFAQVRRSRTESARPLPDVDERPT